MRQKPIPSLSLTIDEKKLNLLTNYCVQYCRYHGPFFDFSHTMDITSVGFVKDLVNMVRDIQSGEALMCRQDWINRVTDTLKRYVRPVELAIKTNRYYFSRGDFRAYYRDTNQFRSICVAIIQSILLPNNKE